MTEWLETVEQFTAEAVEEACKRLKRRNVAFLPSAGQIFTECQNAAADIRATVIAQTKMLPKPDAGVESNNRFWMEKWERQNGRPYPHKAQVEALLTDPKSKLYDANFKGFNS